MIETFELERFFAPYEFDARHLLCASDCETRTVGELFELEADLAQRMAALPLHYSPTEGTDELRAAVAEMHGSHCTPDEVVIVPGGGPSLELTFRSLLEPGDSIVVVTPCYQTYLSLPRSLGCEVKEVPLEERPEGWTLDLDRLRSAMAPGTRALVVNLPHNPTGYLPDRGTFEGILEIAEACDATLVCDEIFRMMEHDPADRLPSARDLYERTVVVGGLSKSFGLPGLRIGWIVTREPEVRHGAVRWTDYAAKDSSAPSQLLAAAVVRQREPLLEANRDLALANLALAEAFFERNADRVRWSAPRAGVIGVPRLVEGESQSLFEGLYRQSATLIAPGGLFQMSPDRFRIGFGHRDFPEALALLEEYLQP